ncbi:MAG TPA: GNAT family N-acetyltransferase, partial [Candidatus Ventricola gallistercoris]|nr:GNAT family N-acetyltransferase [Candidatus Ventricola gallistercoris]
IYLSPAFHRRGIGRALMQRLLEMLRRQGVRMAYSCITLPSRFC